MEKAFKLLFCTLPLATLMFLNQTEAMITRTRRPWEMKGFLEGDILINLDREVARNKGVVKNDNQLWPGGAIHYRIAPDLESDRSLIESAMRHIENTTCIRFKERTNEKAFIAIVRDVGCYSQVGRSRFAQPLSLGDGCMKLGIIVHELCHAIGFYHEHTRSDRDDYVEIEWDNISEGYEDQFEKMMPFQHRLLSDFDYDSIMMYGELAFSKDDVSSTMRATRPGVQLVELSEKLGLSEGDIIRINTLYKCNL